jgi:pathogenesis-related protein 1
MLFIRPGTVTRLKAFSGTVTLAFYFAITGCAVPDAQPAPSPAKSTKSAKAAKSPDNGQSHVMSRSDINAITAYHNKVRRDVGVGPLKWSPSLAEYAGEWADRLAQTSCKMNHRSEGKFGENLYTGTAGHFSAVDAAKAWETEKKLYAGGVLTRENWYPAGHYTQMVWRNTSHLGCGESICKGMLMVVCNYDPPGNYIGQSPY